MAKEKRDKDGFIVLDPIPGGRFDQFKQKRKKIPKNPDKYLDMFVDKYGVDAVANMQEIDIGDYVYDKGLNHALNMTVGRSIPWIEDGLKRVERRILYTMYLDKLYGGKYDKVAGITGDMLKQFHPHGEMSVNDTIYRLGRPRSMMIPYIKGKGNFGSMDDMKPAAPRYASATLSEYAMSCFFSEMGTKYPIFDVTDNYKYSEKEPIFLTSKYPNILMQWNQGIAVGVSTWLGAFNSVELLKVVIKMLDDPDCKVDIYPDTPVPINIINKSELKGCFDMAKFKVKMRAPYQIVEDKQRDDHGRIVDKHTLVFTSLPISTTGNTIYKQIQEIKADDEKKSSSEKKLPEVIHMETDVSVDTPGGINFSIIYEKGYDPDALAEKLYKSTQLGRTVGVQYTLITDNQANLYTPREIIKIWISQRYDQKRRYYHQKVLKAAKDRAMYEAICTILESKKNIDEAIAIIRNSKNDEETIDKLSKRFGFTAFQSTCILQIKLKNLQKMDIEETKKQRDAALAEYKHYRKLLTEDDAIKKAIKAELEECITKYGKPRMAKVYDLKTDSIGDVNGSRYVVYNDTVFYSAEDTEKLSKIVSRAEKDYRILELQNKESVLVVARNAATKILNGYAFNYTDAGIKIDQLGVPSIANIIPLNNKLQGVVLLTASGYGKFMEINEITKSTKSKIMTLPADDTLVAAIPIYDKDSVIAAWIDGRVYYAPLADFPTLKRTSLGNRIFKAASNLVQATALPAAASHWLIYSEFGYLKVVDTSVLKFNKRHSQTINMDGRFIQGIVPIMNNIGKLWYYNKDGATQMNIEVGKMVRLSIGIAETKFRLGTTIGAPAKALKNGRNEFYQFK